MVQASASRDMSHLHRMIIEFTKCHIYTNGPQLHVYTLTGKFVWESVLGAVIFLIGICIADWLMRAHFINDLVSDKVASY